MNKETQLEQYLGKEYPDYKIQVISTGWYGYFETRFLVQMIGKDSLDLYLQFRYLDNSSKWEVFTEKNLWWGITFQQDCGDSHGFTIELINKALAQSKQRITQWKERELAIS